MNKLIKQRDFQTRYEQFGGIISSEEPPFLAHVDRDFMKKCGYEDSPLWIGDESESGNLSAPLEVHFSITNRCNQGCDHCYTNSTPNAEGELPFDEVCRIIDSFADIGIFHIALGGGEATEREDLFEIAKYARNIGIIPNLTTSGMAITEENVHRFSIFGQVNISLDSLDTEAHSLRKGNSFDRIEKLKLLKKSGVRCGINTVLTRENFDKLPTLIKTVKKLRLREIELLRLKPSGRAFSALYDEHKLTDEQNRILLPQLKKLYRKYRIHLKIDCSFVPMVLWHNPDKKLIDKLSLYGCEAGEVLLGVAPNGEVSGCSFLKNSEIPSDYSTFLEQSDHINKCKSWIDTAPQPCSNCDYLSLCKGGCRAVSIYSGNDFFKPDPECPRVVEYRNEMYERNIL